MQERDPYTPRPPSDPTRRRAGNTHDADRADARRPVVGEPPRSPRPQRKGIRLTGRSGRGAGRSTKKTRPISLPPRGVLITVIIACSLSIVAALIWGLALKRQSDAYHAAHEADAWTVEPSPSVPYPITVPPVRGVMLASGASTEGLGGRNGCSNVTLTLTREADGCLPYALPIAIAQNIPTRDGARTFSDEVRRFHAAGVTVTCLFRVTCLDPAVRNDPSLAPLLRGIELALLTDAASSGADELLLEGLPCGDDASDAMSADFLRELKTCLSALTRQPAVGVVLDPEAFALRAAERGETSSAAGTSDGEQSLIYAGSLTPGRLRSVCDFLALDLRGETEDSLPAVLKGFRYAYARFSLRLLLPRAADEETARSHGMTDTVIPGA